MSQTVENVMQNAIRNVRERREYEASKDTLTKQKARLLDRCEAAFSNPKVIEFAMSLGCENFAFINEASREVKEHFNIRAIEKLYKTLNALILQDSSKLDTHTRLILLQVIHVTQKTKDENFKFSSRLLKAAQSVANSAKHATKLDQKLRKHYDGSTTSTQTSSTMNVLCALGLARKCEEKDENSDVFVFNVNNAALDFLRS